MGIRRGGRSQARRCARREERCDVGKSPGPPRPGWLAELCALIGWTNKKNAAIKPRAGRPGALKCVILGRDSCFVR
ncbi:MAG: hypothetical protein MI923_18695 [Phycisphaerales bacterium]|nr:hypothetical protein [Phycisphaerales bacterium]